MGRAELSYPFHIASLARRYRIGTHSAEQKDGLLQLGEGIARVLGILALQRDRACGGFDANMRRSFHSGAAFGRWTTIIRKLVESVNEPRLPDLARLADPDGVSALLDTLREIRNGTYPSQLHSARVGNQQHRIWEHPDPGPRGGSTQDRAPLRRRHREDLLGRNGAARDSILDVFKLYLQQRTAEGSLGTSQLLAEIRRRRSGRLMIVEPMQMPKARSTTTAWFE